MSFILSQAVYDSALDLTSCLCRAWKSARGESLGPSQVFSKYAPCPGHVHGFLDSQEFMEALQNDYYPKHLISSLSSPSSSICLPFAPDFWSSVPHHFSWLHWSFKSSDLVYFSFYKGATQAQRWEVTFPGPHGIGMLGSWTSTLSTSGLDELWLLQRNQVQVEHRY